MTPGLTTDRVHNEQALPSSASAHRKLSPTVPSDSYHASSTEEALRDERDFAAHNYHPLPVVFARAQGCKVWDPEDREYLDFV